MSEKEYTEDQLNDFDNILNENLAGGLIQGGNVQEGTVQEGTAGTVQAGTAGTVQADTVQADTAGTVQDVAVSEVSQNLVVPQVVVPQTVEVPSAAQWLTGGLSKQDTVSRLGSLSRTSRIEKQYFENVPEVEVYRTVEGQL